MLLTDQVGRSVYLADFPKRIVSLVPSLSEFIWDLGLKKELVGITKFCIHPKEMFSSVQRIGGTKNPSIEKIAHLKPELIIANKEENTEESVSDLEKICPVYVSDVNSLQDSYVMMKDIGVLTNKEVEASEIIFQTKLCFEKHNLYSSLRVVYVIWQNPIMSVASSTFINNLLMSLGFQNCFSGKNRYPETNFDEIRDLNPDCIFLSSEPFPFTQEHCKEWKLFFPETKIVLVDGEFFSWYGSRLMKSRPYFDGLFRELNLP